MVVTKKMNKYLKKLNKTYSIVIVPNSNDKVRRLSIKAPLVKFLFFGILTLAILIPVSVSFATKIKGQSETNIELQNQLAKLTQTLLAQNDTLALANSQIEALNSIDSEAKQKIQTFSKMYADIANDYVSKSSRGTSNKSTTNAIEDIIKLSSAVEDLNKAFSHDDQLSEKLRSSSENLEKFAEAIPTFVPAKGKITSPFGMRKHPITKIRTNHNGIDIDSPKGDPIYAAASGEVIFSGYTPGFGYHIIIDHKNGFQTLYAHSSKLISKKGDLVKKGQKIANVGSTGRSTGPHLHFEMRIYDSLVNPIDYINF